MHIEADVPPLPQDEYVFNLSDPSAYMAGGAHGTWKLLRQAKPIRLDVAPNGTPYWSFFSYRDCQLILKDPSTFSSTSGAILTSIGEPDPFGGGPLALTDPPEHTRIRRPSNRRLGPAAVRGRDDEIRAGVRHLIKPLIANGEHDLALVLRQLPMIAAGPLLGVPAEFWESIAFHTLSSIAPEDPAFSLGTPGETRMYAHFKLFQSIKAAIRSAPAHPDDNLIHELLSVPIDACPMDEQRVLLNVHSALIGGNNATVNVALHLMLRLAENTDLWQEVVDEPAIIPGLVEEAARWTTPAQQLVRRVTAEVEIGGARLHAGDWVAAWIASANRDESVFASPYEFDPRRAPNPHLGFGAGPHYCVGAAASRVVIAALIEELAERNLRFRMTREPRHLKSTVVNGITSLPMRFFS